MTSSPIVLDLIKGSAVQPTVTVGRAITAPRRRRASGGTLVPYSQGSALIHALTSGSTGFLNDACCENRPQLRPHV
jgi:hypothetical protein